MSTSVIVRGIPPRLKGKMAKAADKRGISFNELLIATFADHFEIPYEPAPRKKSAAVGPSATTVAKNVPVEIRDALDAAAEAAGESKRNVQIRILCDAFGVPFVPTGRWQKASA